MNNPVLVEIDQQPIELCKLLKIANLVGGGGEAKIVISEGYVYLNGEVEFQKRKKIVEHDVVEFNGEIIQVALSEHYVERSQSKPKNNLNKIKKNTKKDKKALQINEAPSQKPKLGGRKPISF